MKRGRTLPLTGAQIVALADLYQGRRAATSHTRALVRLGFAAWTESDETVVTDAGVATLRHRTILCPLGLDEGQSRAMRFAVVERDEHVAFVYVYAKGRQLGAPGDTAGPLAVLSSTTHALAKEIAKALERIALDVVAERPNARKSIDVTEDVDAARRAATVGSMR